MHLLFLVSSEISTSIGANCAVVISFKQMRKKTIYRPRSPILGATLARIDCRHPNLRLNYFSIED
ncbi:hypothetical protein CPY51_23805 [Rhizobium tubonense]|uniref:Uncharacterized protein n=1 Tax=Rhizobium tubonense TaxID=484088 RepID=A0A2W4CA08_9HYPH|nr:hypothetical protein CPY51_23805 [Rhizobium tubonense]